MYGNEKCAGNGYERRNDMNWLKTNNHGRTNQTIWSMTLLVGVAMMSAVPRSNAQALRKGISVELAPTSSAVPVPDADKQDALIVTVTESGKIYLGPVSVAPDSLAEEFKD